MQKKAVLVGTFVKKCEVLAFLEKLKCKNKLNLNKVFVYEINGNKNEYLVTFKSYDRDKHANEFKSSTIMHVKNNCLFSINALNKLIHQEHGENINVAETEINWNNYKDKLIILANGELTINNITKIEDKCLFLG